MVMLFNLARLEHHHYQSNGKSIATSVIGKVKEDERFKVKVTITTN